MGNQYPWWLWSQINQASKLDRYPIPKIEDLFIQLARGKSSEKYVVSNTHRWLSDTIIFHSGLLLPREFSRVRKVAYQELLTIFCHQKDWTSTSSSTREASKRMSDTDIRLKDKCVFLVHVFWLLDWRPGHLPCDGESENHTGSTMTDKVSQPKSYLGLLTYYSLFLPKLSSTLVPLYELLKCSVQWRWTDQQEKHWRSCHLVHFNPGLKIQLALYASCFTWAGRDHHHTKRKTWQICNMDTQESLGWRC